AHAPHAARRLRGRLLRGDGVRGRGRPGSAEVHGRRERGGRRDGGAGGGRDRPPAGGRRRPLLEGGGQLAGVVPDRALSGAPVSLASGSGYSVKSVPSPDEGPPWSLAFSAPSCSASRPPTQRPRSQSSSSPRGSTPTASRCRARRYGGWGRVGR